MMAALFAATYRIVSALSSGQRDGPSCPWRPTGRGIAPRRRGGDRVGRPDVGEGATMAAVNPTIAGDRQAIRTGDASCGSREPRRRRCSDPDDLRARRSSDPAQHSRADARRLAAGRLLRSRERSCGCGADSRSQVRRRAGRRLRARRGGRRSRPRRSRAVHHGISAGPDVDRVLATVLFTDIVDSTALAARLGDRGWRAFSTPTRSSCARGGRARRSRRRLHRRRRRGDLRRPGSRSPLRACSETVSMLSASRSGPAAHRRDREAR